MRPGVVRVNRKKKHEEAHLLQTVQTEILFHQLTKKRGDYTVSQGFHQRDFVRDFIFPLGIGKDQGNGETLHERFVGTGFLVGKSGMAMTAAHVIPDLKKDQHFYGMFVAADQTWRSFPVQSVNKHPSEDVALLSIEGSREKWDSPIIPANAWHGPSGRYMQFGYP